MQAAAESGRPVMARVPAKFSETARIAEISTSLSRFSGVSLIAGNDAAAVTQNASSGYKYQSVISPSVGRGGPPRKQNARKPQGICSMTMQDHADAGSTNANRLARLTRR